jgi:hypothetical protein
MHEDMSARAQMARQGLIKRTYSVIGIWAKRTTTVLDRDRIFCRLA